jgi:hypothetical protein
MMARCIELDMQCSAICYAAAQLMSMGSESALEVCRICAELCERCGDECGRHHTEHCQECAKACKACAEECRKMAGMAV